MVKQFADTTISDELYEKIVGNSVIDGDGYIGEGKFSKVHYKDIGGNFHSKAKDGKLVLKEIYYDSENDTLYLSKVDTYRTAVIIDEYIIKGCGKYIESENHGLYKWDLDTRPMITFMESLPNGGTGHWVIGADQIVWAECRVAADFSGNTVQEKQRTEAAKRTQERKAEEQRAKQEEIIKKKEAEERAKQEELAKKKEAEELEKQKEIAKKEAEERAKQEEIAKKEAEERAKQEEITKKKEAEELEKQKEIAKKEVEELEKQKEIAKKEVEELEKQKEIAKKEVEELEKQKEITKKEAELTKKEAEIAKKEAELTKKEAELTKKEAEIAKKDVEIPNKEADVENVKFSSEKIVVEDLLRDDNSTGLDKGSINTVNDEIVLDSNNASSNNGFIVDLQPGNQYYNDHQIGCEGCGSDSILF